MGGMIRQSAALFFLLSLAALTGCSDNYDVVVTNRLPDTVTLWLTRSKEPYEKAWVPPEVWAIGTHGNDPIGGVVLHSGVSCEAKVSGKHDSDNPAVLRVYRSTNMNAVLAMSLGNPGRTDYVIQPGRTDVDVVAVDGELTIVPHGAPTQPSP
jgi:hypothetical protein